MKELLLCAYDYDQYNNKASVSMLSINFFKLQFTREKFGSGCYWAVMSSACLDLHKNLL